MLHGGTDLSEGSGIEPVLQIINGQLTTFGVILTDLSSDITRCYPEQLAAADVIQIESWVVCADVGATKAMLVVVFPVQRAT